MNGKRNSLREEINFSRNQCPADKSNRRSYMYVERRTIRMFNKSLNGSRDCHLVYNTLKINKREDINFAK